MVLSPRSESANPFSNLLENGLSPNPPAARKYQTTHIDRQSPGRLQRKNSRSSSRRAEPASTLPIGTLNQSWYIEPNAHSNGGLKNAVDSVSTKLQRTLWVGTLGTSTDKFGDALRNEIDRKMLRQYSSLPVWIPDAEFENCYDEFCHQVSALLLDQDF
jgi:trehalose 6-phosphate synthase complex regulatory subunit